MDLTFTKPIFSDSELIVVDFKHKKVLLRITCSPLLGYSDKEEDLIKSALKNSIDSFLPPLLNTMKKSI